MASITAVSAVGSPPTLDKVRQQVRESNERIEEFHQWENSVRFRSAQWTQQLAESARDENAGVLHGVNTFLFS